MNDKALSPYNTALLELGRWLQKQIDEARVRVVLRQHRQERDQTVRDWRLAGASASELARTIYDRALEDATHQRGELTYYVMAYAEGQKTYVDRSADRRRDPDTPPRSSLRCRFDPWSENFLLIDGRCAFSRCLGSVTPPSSRIRALPARPALRRTSPARGSARAPPSRARTRNGVSSRKGRASILGPAPALASQDVKAFAPSATAAALALR